MIKTTDIIGSLIVLSSYLLLASASHYALFAILSFFIGVGISAYGLKSNSSEMLSFAYVYTAIGLFGSIFLFLVTPIGAAWIYAIPGITASLSLTIAYYSKKDILKTYKQKSSPI